jgi:hypothetical protein
MENVLSLAPPRAARKLRAAYHTAVAPTFPRESNPQKETQPLTYRPAPVDTARVTLTRELLNLGEVLATNVHEVWSQQRLAEGWRYGLERNDARKEHPDLLPYEQLTEGEKEYDRSTAIGVIRLILVLGYRIEPPQ